MRLYLTIGAIILAVTALIALFFGNLEYFMYISAIIGFLFFSVGLISTGNAFLPGDRIREISMWEPKEETKRRFKLFIPCLLIGLPNLIVSMIIYFLFF